jgi:hypothetical protein
LQKEKACNNQRHSVTAANLQHESLPPTSLL